MKKILLSLTALFLLTAGYSECPVYYYPKDSIIIGMETMYINADSLRAAAVANGGTMGADGKVTNGFAVVVLRQYYALPPGSFNEIGFPYANTFHEKIAQYCFVFENPADSIHTVFAGVPGGIDSRHHGIRHPSSTNFNPSEYPINTFINNRTMSMCYGISQTVNPAIVGNPAWWVGGMDIGGIDAASTGAYSAGDGVTTYDTIFACRVALVVNNIEKFIENGGIKVRKFFQEYDSMAYRYNYTHVAAGGVGFTSLMLIWNDIRCNGYNQQNVGWTHVRTDPYMCGSIISIPTGGVIVGAPTAADMEITATLPNSTTAANHSNVCPGDNVWLHAPSDLGNDYAITWERHNSDLLLNPAFPTSTDKLIEIATNTDRPYEIIKMTATNGTDTIIKGFSLTLKQCGIGILQSDVSCDYESFNNFSLSFNKYGWMANGAISIQDSIAGYSWRTIPGIFLQSDADGCTGFSVPEARVDSNLEVYFRAVYNDTQYSNISSLIRLSSTPMPIYIDNSINGGVFMQNYYTEGDYVPAGGFGKVRFVPEMADGFYTDPYSGTEIITEQHSWLLEQNGSTTEMYWSNKFDTTGTYYPSQPTIMGKIDTGKYSYEVITRFKYYISSITNGVNVKQCLDTTIIDVQWVGAGERITVNNSSLLPSNTLNVHPNPTSNILYIDNPDKDEILVFSLNGKLVKRGYGNKINLGKQPSGMYIIQVGNKTARIIKK
jgi:hypothetical protein